MPCRGDRMKKKITEVFTPRRSDVNHAMYVGRPSLERELRRGLAGSQHLLLYGESGNGKSWLYKNLFEIDNIHYVAANCGNASRNKSITEEILQVAFPNGRIVKDGYAETKAAGASLGFADGKIENESIYSCRSQEPLLISFHEIAKNSSGQPAVVVLENLESIFSNEELMGELADIVILLDDARYSKLNIKLLIVGTPAGVLEYFLRTKNQESVANRIFEISKVDNLDYDQVLDLITKGFVHELGVDLTLEETISIAKHAHNVTMGVAQRLHEYCEGLAYVIEAADGKFLLEHLDSADWDWLCTGLRQSYAIVESNLNSRDTAVSRRNQVLYAIGQLKKPQFLSSDIEAIIRKDFPATVPETNMGTGSILTELANREDALLIRNKKTGLYRVKDPRYTMCIRTVLYIHPDSKKVAKRYFKDG